MDAARDMYSQLPGKHASGLEVQAIEALAAFLTSGTVCDLTSNPQAPQETAAEGLEKNAEPRNSPEPTSAWSHVPCSVELEVLSLCML